MVSSAFRASVFAALFLASGGAQAAPPADPFVEEVVAIRAKHIETISKGVIENGVILVRNGKITAIGKDVKIPVGATILIADTVMPGLVGVDSRIGLTGGLAADTAPAPVRGGGGAGQFAGAARGVANPHFRVADELYPFDANYARLARAGVTTLALSPSGSAISGQGVVIRPVGDTVETMTVVPGALLSVSFAANTQTIDLIRSTFEAVRPQPDPTLDDGSDPFAPPFSAQNEARDAGDDTQGRRQRPGGRGIPGAAGPATGNAEERRAPVLKAFNGTIPTFINCPDDASVSYALPLFQAFATLKPVYILNAPDSYRIAYALGAKKASVILSAALVLEPLTTNRINLPAILSKAGAKIACRPPTDDVEGYRGLRFKMGELVKYGLDREVALRAITLTPAEMLGVSDRVGSLDVGRDGNLLLLTGDPLEAGSRLTRVLLEGKVVYEGD